MNSKELYHLVKSMSKSEKRYFRLYCNGLNNKTKLYLKLFDAFDKTTELDEKKIKRKFGANYSQTKNYLSKNILKALANYQDDPEKQIFRLIDEYKVLSSRGFLKLAETPLKKAMDIAKSFKMIKLQLLISDYHFDLLSLNNTAFDQRFFEATDKNLDEEKGWIKIIGSGIKAKKHHQKVKYAIHRKNRFLEKLQSDASSQTISSIDEEFDDISTIMYRIRNFFHVQFYNDAPFNESFCNQALHFFDQYNFVSKKYPLLYLGSLSFISHWALISDRNDYYEKVQQAISDVKDDVPLLRMHKFIHRFQPSFFILFRQLKFDEAEDFFKAKKSFFESYDPIIPLYYKDFFNYYFAHLLQINEKYEEALVFTHRTLQNKKHSNIEDFYYFTRFLHFIIHFEVRNYYYIRTTYSAGINYFKTQKNSKIVLIIYKAICKAAKDPANKAGIFKKCKQSIEDSSSITKADSEAVLSRFDYQSWLQSQAENIPFRKKIMQKEAYF